MQKHIPELSVLIYPDEGKWIATALDFDVTGDGLTQSQALERLQDCLNMQIEVSQEYNNPANLLTESPDYYWSFFEIGEPLEGQTLDLHSCEFFRFDELEIRVLNGFAPSPNF